MPSNAFRTSAFSPEVDDIWIILLTITHANLSDSIRVANNLEPIISNSATYNACPFDIKLPNDLDEGVPGATLRINNVSQDVVIAVREIDTPAIVNIQIVLASNPDLVEIEYLGLELRNVRGDAGSIEGVLGYDDLLLEAFPIGSFGPSYFPGLF